MIGDRSGVNDAIDRNTKYTLMFIVQTARLPCQGWWARHLPPLLEGGAPHLCHPMLGGIARLHYDLHYWVCM